jgi:hypothetical protein
MFGFISSVSQAGVTYVADNDTTFTSQTQLRITRPSAAKGDVALMCGWGGDDAAITGNPTEFTEIFETGTSTGDDRIMWGGLRRITGTEANTVDTLTAAARAWNGGTIILRGVEARFPYFKTATTASSNVADPVNATITTTEDSDLVIFWAGSTDTSTAATVTDPSGVTRLWVRKDVSANNFNSSFCGYQNYPTPGATGSKTWDLNTSVTTAEVTFTTIRFRADHDGRYRAERQGRAGAIQFRKATGQIQ